MWCQNKSNASCYQKSSLKLLHGFRNASRNFCLSHTNTAFHISYFEKEKEVESGYEMPSENVTMGWGKGTNIRGVTCSCDLNSQMTTSPVPFALNMYKFTCSMDSKDYYGCDSTHYYWWQQVVLWVPVSKTQAQLNLIAIKVVKHSCSFTSTGDFTTTHRNSWCEYNSRASCRGNWTQIIKSRQPSHKCQHKQ